MLRFSLFCFVCLFSYMAYGQTQAEQTFHVSKPLPQPREYYRAVSLPDHATCKESMAYQMDSNLVPGDTIKLQLGEYTIGAYQLICMHKGEIFKVNGYRGIIDKGVFKAFNLWRNKPDTELYFEVTVLLTRENKPVTLKNPWSYRLAW